MSTIVRILLLADTHLGFDLPVRPRVRRRRRGQDFLDNYHRALEPALRGEVDLVVHGGDVFNRSRPHATVAYQAFEPLTRVADRGVPVFVVPGNHERGRLPHLRFASHPGIHVFDEPRTFRVEVRGVPVALAGFPSERDEVRARFGDLTERTGWREQEAGLRLLCLHQCVEGATVGPADYTFTTATDVIRGRDLPRGFAAVLAGHIHRHQVLRADQRGRPLAAPVLYPGSIERTSIAEAGETKGFMIVTAAVSERGVELGWSFEPLPARPLVVREVSLADKSADELRAELAATIETVPSDSVLTLRVRGDWTEAARRALASDRLRELAPETMNVELRLPGLARQPRAPRSAEPVSLELPL
ncbi:MAG: exonuclease SbcCD subunit D [Gemmatimonadales bacterium]